MVIVTSPLPSPGRKNRFHFKVRFASPEAIRGNFHGKYNIQISFDDFRPLSATGHAKISSGIFVGASGRIFRDAAAGEGWDKFWGILSGPPVFVNASDPFSKRL